MTRTGFDPQKHGFAFSNWWEFDDAERERLHETFAGYLRWGVITGAAAFGLPGALFAIFGIRALRKAMESHLAPAFGLCGGMCFAAIGYDEDETDPAKGTITLYDPNCPNVESPIHITFGEHQLSAKESCGSSPSLRGFFCEDSDFSEPPEVVE